MLPAVFFLYRALLVKHEGEEKELAVICLIQIGADQRFDPVDPVDQCVAVDVQSCRCACIIAGIDQEPVEGIGIYRIVVLVILDQISDIGMQHILQSLIRAYMAADLVKCDLAHGYAGLSGLNSMVQSSTSLGIVFFKASDIIKLMADAAAEIGRKDSCKLLIQFLQIRYIFQVDQGYDMIIVYESLGEEFGIFKIITYPGKGQGFLGLFACYADDDEGI